MPIPRKVLLLEGQLDADTASVRSQKEFMRILGTAYQVGNKKYVREFIAKEVHSLADFKYFIDLVRKDRSANYLVHFVGHGESTEKETFLQLTNGDKISMKSKKGLSIFRDLPHVEILLSCCGVGKDQKALDTLRRVSGAQAVFAYTSLVYDYQAFLIDSMLYHLLFGPVPWRYDEIPYQSIGKRVQDAIESLLLFRNRKKILACSC